MSYDENYFLARGRWRDWRIEAHELIRLAQIERGARVLEIGCGSGGLLRILHERGAQAVGVDTLDVALRLARKIEWKPGGVGDPKFSPPLPRSPIHLPALIQVSEDNHLPFAAGTFDAILGQHIIEHIAEVEAALREWHRLLKPSGRLALATPNAHYPDPAHFSDADHAHIFSPHELRDLFRRVGFSGEEYFTAFPFLTRNRILRGLGIVGYDLFRRLPYFAERGRTILVGARRN